jgi:hypothetical protein
MEKIVDGFKFSREDYEGTDRSIARKEIGKKKKSIPNTDQNAVGADSKFRDENLCATDNKDKAGPLADVINEKSANATRFLDGSFRKYKLFAGISLIIILTIYAAVWAYSRYDWKGLALSEYKTQNGVENINYKVRSAAISKAKEDDLYGGLIAREETPEEAVITENYYFNDTLTENTAPVSKNIGSRNINRSTQNYTRGSDWRTDPPEVFLRTSYIDKEFRSDWKTDPPEVFLRTSYIDKVF